MAPVGAAVAQVRATAAPTRAALAQVRATLAQLRATVAPMRATMAQLRATAAPMRAAAALMRATVALIGANAALSSGKSDFQSDPSAERWRESQGTVASIAKLQSAVAISWGAPAISTLETSRHARAEPAFNVSAAFLKSETNAAFVAGRDLPRPHPACVSAYAPVWRPAARATMSSGARTARSCHVEVTESIDGVPIRLTAERWLHVVENHDEVAGYYDEVLETVASPDIIVPGYQGSLIAVRSYGRQRHLCVVYRKVSRTDGFIITAYLSRTIDRRKAIWKRA